MLHLQARPQQILLAATHRSYSVPPAVCCLEKVLVFLLRIYVWVTTCWTARTESYCYMDTPQIRSRVESDIPRLYNSPNYSDDIGGCEDTLERATEAYDALGNLFSDLGLKESASKAHPSATSMPYLGIQFDTVKRTMSIPSDKI